MYSPINIFHALFLVGSGRFSLMAYKIDELWAVVLAHKPTDEGAEENQGIAFHWGANMVVSAHEWTISSEI